MFDSTKNYWLYISPHVYCLVKGSSAVLYNTRNGCHMETDDEEQVAILNSLHNQDNLGVIYFEGIMLSDPRLEKFVVEFCEKGMGGLADVSSVTTRPVQMMPVLNLQQDIEKLRGDDGNVLFQNTLHYLLELNIYLNSHCGQHCLHCGRYSRQSLCCRVSSEEEGGELEEGLLADVMSQIRHGVVGKINLLGGDVFGCSYYERLPSLLSSFKGSVHVWHHYKECGGTEKIHPGFNYDLVVTFPCERNALQSCLALYEKTRSAVHFYVTDVAEYEQAEQAAKDLGIPDYAIHPVFIGTNGAFFEEYVYTTKDEILGFPQDFRQIFAHQKLNTNSFGVLSILPSGEVYANLNKTSLGNINDSSLLYFVNKELTENTSWRKIRNEHPCCECLFQHLCPSPSNYEIAMDKPNLCHVKP